MRLLVKEFPALALQLDHSREALASLGFSLPHCKVEYSLPSTHLLGIDCEGQM